MSEPSPTADDEWEDLLPRLLLWAQRLHSRVLHDVRGAPSPEDLVQDAVTDVLTGRRSRPDDVPLAVLLYGVIRSRASQVLSKAKTRGEAPGPRYIGMEEAAEVHARTSDPAQSADLREHVLSLVRDDETLTRMVALWFEDPGLKPADLAEMLGLSASEVYAATRRLRRRGERVSLHTGDTLAFSAPAWQILSAQRPLGVNVFACL